MPSDTKTELAASFHGRALKLEWPKRALAVATLTRPDALNVLSLDLLKEFSQVLEIAKRTPARALVLIGSGRAFCAGADLKLFTDPAKPIGDSPMELRDNYLARIGRLFDKMEEMPFPIIAAINGFALGGGCEMALSADIRLMSRSAKIGLPEVRLGAIPGAGGVQKLIRHVGRSRALEWILTGAHISAEQAEKAGLVMHVTEPEELLPRAMEVARGFLGLGPRAVAQAKMSIYVAEDVDIRSARQFGLEALTALAGTAEWAEGLKAFLEKREPKFRW